MRRLWTVGFLVVCLASGLAAQEGAAPQRGGAHPVKGKAEAAEAPRASGAAASPTLPEAVAEVWTAADDLLERQVEALRHELQALVGGAQEALESLIDEGGERVDWTALGIDPQQAREIADLEADVTALRARLRLLDLQDSGRVTGGEFRPVTEVSREAALGGHQPDAEAEAPASSEEPERETAAEVGGAPADGAPLPRSRFPAREAVLAFLAGDEEAVETLIGGLDAAALPDDALYVLGSVRTSRRDFEGAKAVFEILAGRHPGRILSYAATRQLVRIEHLEKGIVDLAPLLKESLER